MHYVLDLIIVFYYSYRVHKVNVTFRPRTYQRVYPSVDLSTMRGTAKAPDHERDKSLLNNTVSSSEIKVGDILCLKEGDIAPCDMLLFNSSDLVNNVYTCTVDSGFCAGTIRPETKISLRTTRPFGKLFKTDEQVEQALNRLSGTIEYWPFEHNDRFKGTFKLKSDPKIDDLSNENLIRKGSLILSSHAIGLAIFCGENSLYYKVPYQDTRYKSSAISKRVWWYSVSTIIINLIFSLISTMILMIKGSEVYINKQLDPYVQNGLKLFSFIVLYSPVLPLFVVTLCNLIGFIQANTLEKQSKDYISEDKSSSESLNSEAGFLANHLQSLPIFVANPWTLSNLGGIEEVYFDKTGTLSNPGLEIMSVATMKKVYRTTVSNFAIVGTSVSKASKVKASETNDFERSFEGYDSEIFQAPTRSDEEDSQVYDFGSRKVLQNPFAHSPAVKDSNTEENPEDQGKLGVYPDDRFLNVSNTRKDYRTSSMNKVSDEIERVYDELEFTTDTKTDKEVKNLLMLCTLCHNAKVNKNEEYLTNNIDEKCLLKFSEQFNYAFQASNNNPGFESDEGLHQKTYDIKIQDGSVLKFEICLISEDRNLENRFSIILREPDTRKYWLYVRGSHETMENIIDFGGHNGQVFQRIVRTNKEAGLRSLVFARKPLEETEVSGLVDRYKKITQSSTDVDTELASLMNPLESNLKYIATLGLKKSVREESLEVIEKIKQMGVKVHMVTGDRFEAAFYTSKYLKMFPNGLNNYLVLDFVDDKDALVKIREVLDKLKTQLATKPRSIRDSNEFIRSTSLASSREDGIKRAGTIADRVGFFNKTFMVSGRSIEVVENDRYLYNHLAFILQFGHSIIGYEMRPLQKGVLIQLMREVDRAKRVMAVGDGLNDIYMLQMADVSVQIHTEHTNLVYGDIVTENLRQIPDMLLLHGVRYNSNLSVAVRGSFFMSIMITCYLFFYQFYCGFTATAAIQTGLIYGIYGAYSLLCCIYFLYENIYPDKLRRLIPALYIENIFTNKIDLRKFMYLLGEAIVSAAVLFYPSIYYMHSQYTESGVTINGNVMTLHLIYGTHLVSILQFLYTTRRGYFMVGTILINLLIWALIWLCLIMLQNFTSVYEVAMLELLTDPNIVVGFLLSTATVFFLNWGFWLLVTRKSDFPVLENMIEMSESESAPDSLPALNTMLLNSFYQEREITNLVRNCFGIEDEMHNLIENMLSKSSNKHVSISPKWLDIMSNKLTKKFEIYSVKRYLKKLRIQYSLAFLGLLCFSVITALIGKKLEQIFFVNFGITVCMLAILLVTITRAFEINVDSFMWIMIPCFAIIAAFNSQVRGSDHSLLSVVLSVFSSANFNISFRQYTVNIVLQFFWYCISYPISSEPLRSYLKGKEHEVRVDVFAITSLISLVLFIFIVGIVQRYRIERLIKREFISGSVLQSRSNLTSDLLKLLLPTFVLDKMKSFDITGKNIEDDAVDVDEVTILFCDIADFDSVIKSKENHVVRILDSIFRRFDELCNENGMQKIETVGKTYMACGGLKYVEQTLSKDMKETNHATRTLNLAKKMMSEIKNYEDLTLKIGIHRGRCMMGVIGYHKPQFSLIGDTVNTTSRHCTTGEKGHIMVSEEAWSQIPVTARTAGGYFHKLIPTEMKGKGMVPVHHVIPLQGVLKKKLQAVIDKFKDEGRTFTPSLVVFEKLLKKSRQEIKRNFMDNKFNQLLKKAMENANKEIELEAPIQKAEMLDVPVTRTNTRKKSGSQSHHRAGKRGQTKLPPKTLEELGSQDPENGFEDSDYDEENAEYANLKPTPLLNFKKNQYYLVTKYRAKVKSMNKNVLRLYLGILAAHFFIQLVLHIVTPEGFVFTDRTLGMVDKPNLFTIADENRKFAVDFLHPVFALHDAH